MLGVARRAGIIARCHGIFGTDTAIAPMRDEFATALTTEHVATRQFGRPLRGMQTGCPISILPLKGPSAIGPLGDVSVLRFTHGSLDYVLCIEGTGTALP